MILQVGLAFGILCTWVAAFYRLRLSVRERARPYRLYFTMSVLCVALAGTTRAIPAQWIDSLAGRYWTADLLARVFFCAAFMFGLMLLCWLRQPEVMRVETNKSMLTGVLVITALIVGWFALPIEAYPSTPENNEVIAQNGWVAAWRMIFMAYLSWTCFRMVQWQVRSMRHSLQVRDRSRDIGMALVALGMVFAFVPVITFVYSQTLWHSQSHWVSFPRQVIVERLALALWAAGVVTVGLVAKIRWLHRAARVMHDLHPLWTCSVNLLPELVLLRPRAVEWLWNFETISVRRRVEVGDALNMLRPVEQPSGEGVEAVADLMMTPGALTDSSEATGPTLAQMLSTTTSSREELAAMRKLGKLMRRPLNVNRRPRLEQHASK